MLKEQKLMARIKEVQNAENTITNKYYNKKNRATGKKRAVYIEHATKHVTVQPCINDNYFQNQLVDKVNEIEENKEGIAAETLEEEQTVEKLEH